MKGLGLGEETRKKEKKRARKSTSIFQKSLWGTDAKGIFCTLLIHLTKLGLHQKTFRPLSLVIDIKIKETRDQFICLLKLYPCKWSLKLKKKKNKTPTHHTTKTPQKGIELYWQEYPQFMQQWNTSALYSVSCFLCAHFKNNLCTLFKFAGLPSK